MPPSPPRPVLPDSPGTYDRLSRPTLPRARPSLHRSSNTLYGDGGAGELMKVALVKLPAVWAFVFVLRFVSMYFG